MTKRKKRQHEIKKEKQKTNKGQKIPFISFDPVINSPFFLVCFMYLFLSFYFCIFVSIRVPQVWRQAQQDIAADCGKRHGFGICLDLQSSSFYCNFLCFYSSHLRMGAGRFHLFHFVAYDDFSGHLYSSTLIIDLWFFFFSITFCSSSCSFFFFLKKKILKEKKNMGIESSSYGHGFLTLFFFFTVGALFGGSSQQKIGRLFTTCALPLVGGKNNKNKKKKK